MNKRSCKLDKEKSRAKTEEAVLHNREDSKAGHRSKAGQWKGSLLDQKCKIGSTTCKRQARQTLSKAIETDTNGLGQKQADGQEKGFDC